MLKGHCASSSPTHSFSLIVSCFMVMERQLQFQRSKPIQSMIPLVLLMTRPFPPPTRGKVRFPVATSTTSSIGWIAARTLGVLYLQLQTHPLFALISTPRSVRNAQLHVTCLDAVGHATHMALRLVEVLTEILQTLPCSLPILSSMRRLCFSKKTPLLL